MRIVRPAKRGGSESGQAVAFFVGILVLIFGFMAFAIDFGFFFHARRLAQNAADGSVQAGASVLPGCGEGDPVGVALDYAHRNFDLLRTFSNPEDDTIPVPQILPYTVEDPDLGSATFDSVYTRLERNQHFIFAQMFGFVKSRVPADAQAVCGPAKEGGICPYFIQAPDPSAPPEVDADGNLVSAYGITVGRVYAMKVASGEGNQGNYNILNLIDDRGGDAYRDFVSSGCEDPGKNGQPVVVSSDETVETNPGAKSGPTIQALEGGGGSTGLYEPEHDTSMFPNRHKSCNVNFVLDNSGGFGTVVDSNGIPLALAQVTANIDAMTDPSKMSAGQAPCGGLTAVTGARVDGLIHPSVQGRFMQIVMIKGDPQGQSTLDVLGILRMYVGCWSNQDFGGGVCAQNEPPGQVAIYGVFADFSTPNVLQVGGLSSCVLCPKHVVFVK